MAEKIESDVVILGAGLSGLSAGIALAQRGINVLVLEERQQRRPDYWGLTLWPPATRVLKRLGVLHEVADEGCMINMLRWCAADGREWASVNVARPLEESPFVGILPSKLVEILKTAAADNGVHSIDNVEHWSLPTDDYTDSVRIDIRSAEKEYSIYTKLIVGADGPNSSLRERMATRVFRWRPPNQAILTGIGGGVSFRESRQAMGSGWSGGSVPMGSDSSWVYAIVRNEQSSHGVAPIAHYGQVDPQSAHAISQLEDAIEVRPWSLRVRRWEAERVVLIGAAAHAILPHLGLGGMLSLTDVPILAELAERGLQEGRLDASSLKELRLRQRNLVAYARRISEMWAFSMTSIVPGVRQLRDYNFRRLGKRPELLNTFVSTLADAKTPDWRTRLAVWLP